MEIKDMRSNIGNPEMMKAGLQNALIFANNRYQVIIRTVTTPVGPLIQMAINTHDYSPRHDWRELQRIKNELLGTEMEAVELYPAEKRLVDTSNQWVLYAMPPTKIENGLIDCPRWPFGFRDRLVSEYSYKGPNKQRPWPENERPADITEISQTMIADHLAKLLKAHQEQTIEDVQGCEFSKTEEQPTVETVPAAVQPIDLPPSEG